MRGISELATNSQELEKAVQELMVAPGTNTLLQAQEAWRRMFLSRKRYEMLSYGPVEDQAFWTAIFFRGPNSIAVSEVLKANRPIDRSIIERMGSPTKGFAAAEYLLFY